jgi:hypothetical protein
MYGQAKKSTKNLKVARMFQHTRIQFKKPNNVLQQAYRYWVFSILFLILFGIHNLSYAQLTCPSGSICMPPTINVITDTSSGTNGAQSVIAFLASNGCPGNMQIVSDWIPMQGSAPRYEYTGSGIAEIFDLSQEIHVTTSSDPQCKQIIANFWRGYDYKFMRFACPSGTLSEVNFGGTVANWAWACATDDTVTQSIYISGLVQIEPGKSLPLQAKVIDYRNNPVAGVIVHIKVEALSFSGGHYHTNDHDVLRTGKLSGIGPEIIATTPTGPNGVFNFTFNAPLVAGTYKFTAWCENKQCTSQGVNTMDVKVDGLIPLPPSVNFFQEIGQTGKHDDNHYLTPAAIDKAQTLAYYYKDPFADYPLLRYNDASLVWGGVFDLDGDWQPPHSEHARGVVIDVRANHLPDAIPVKNYKMFEKLVTQKIGGNYLHESVGTTNEHFHVRLLKKAE